MRTLIKHTDKQKEKAYSNINLRSFITVMAILVVLLLFCGSLSYFIPQGSFDRDTSGNIIPGTYEAGKVEGIAIWRVITAPARVFASAEALTIIMISVFLLVMSGVFNLLEKTGGIKIFIMRIMRRLRDRGGPVVCITVLIFMLFGSLFGMFEELVTLLPLIIVFMLSMKMDTMMGLGACLMAACFGFSTAITNPFSVGTAAQLAEIPTSSGAWLRIIFFGLVYLIVCVFLMNYLKKIQRNPTLSLTYEHDQEKRDSLLNATDDLPANQDRIFRAYSTFFAIQGVLLVSVACIRAISGFAIPILAASFLITGLIAHKIFHLSKDIRPMAYLSNRHLIQSAGLLFSVPADERNSSTLLKKRSTVLHLPHLHIQSGSNMPYIYIFHKNQFINKTVAARLTPAGSTH